MMIITIIITIVIIIIIIIIIIIMIPFASFASKFLASTTKSQQNGCWLTIRTLVNWSY